MKLHRSTVSACALLLLGSCLPLARSAQSNLSASLPSAVITEVGTRPEVPQPRGGEATLVAIELEPSQQQWVIGTRLGLLGKITNVSSVSLIFYERETVFIAPAETHIYGTNDSRRGCVFFATEGNPALKPVQGDSTKGKSVLLQPGESYWVFWDIDTNGCAGYPYGSEQKPKFNWEQLSQKIMFQPGAYKFVLQSKFYEVPRPGQGGEGTAHFASQQKDVRISASEGMILFAASIGGLLAFIVKKMIPKTVANNQSSPPTVPSIYFLRKRVGGFGSSVLHMLGACLLSVTVVIISSRLGESQFPVQVNVSDFWGALTIGFVGNFLGIYFIQRLINMAPSAIRAVHSATPKPPAHSNGGAQTKGIKR